MLLLIQAPKLHKIEAKDYETFYNIAKNYADYIYPNLHLKVFLGVISNNKYSIVQTPYYAYYGEEGKESILKDYFAEEGPINMQTNK